MNQWPQCVNTVSIQNHVARAFYYYFIGKMYEYKSRASMQRYGISVFSLWESDSSWVVGNQGFSSELCMELGAKNSSLLILAVTQAGDLDWNPGLPEVNNKTPCLKGWAVTVQS